MLILVAYDVSTETAAGRRRLRNVAKACLNYGQRVQNSVFECRLNQSQFEKLEKELVDIIETNEDNLRFYRLLEPVERYIKEFGKLKAIDFSGPLIL